MALIAAATALAKLAACLWLVASFGLCRCEDNPLIFSTHECNLTEPVYGHKFDFTPLSTFGHQAVSDRGDIFDYNICGNLSRTCNGRNNVAACLRRGNQEIVLGTQHVLNYRNGKMYFDYSNGSECASAKGQLYQLHVTVGCDYTLDKNQSHVTAYAADACSFYINLETPHACLPETLSVRDNGCSFRDPQSGYTYDLASLSDSNYRTSDRNGSAFIINICKPVLYGENAMCPEGSAVCFYALSSKDYKKRFFNYGSVQSDPFVINGQLQMRHWSMTPCNGSSSYSSIIKFYCDMEAKNAHPELAGVNGCEYEFSFFTPLACNNLAPCTAITHGSELIDMSPLKGKPFTLHMPDKNYTLAVCGHAGEPCLENDGACLHANGQTTSLGYLDSHLRFNMSGTPYLLYQDGAPCIKKDTRAATTSWQTRIEFVCANNVTSKDNGSSPAVDLPPKIIENSDCELLIHYQTPLACHEQITCKAKAYVEHSEDGTGEEVVDLTPLISTVDNYEAEIDRTAITEQQVAKTTTFFLNVCRPLVSKFGLGCPGGSAACMATVGTAPTPQEERSLGFPLASLVAINRTYAELRYYQGGPCPADPKAQLSSGIEFHCDMRAGRGKPKLLSISDCHYRFIWPTNVICPPHECIVNTDACEIKNDDIGVSYNLRKAPFMQDGKITLKRDKLEFTLDTCGTHGKAVTDYAQGLVNLFFVAKGPCGVDGHVNVQMRLICSSDAVGATTFNDDLQCNWVHVQRTPDICPFLGLAVPPNSTNAATTAAAAATAAAATAKPAPPGAPVPVAAATTSKPGAVTTKAAADAAAAPTTAPHAADAHPAERTGSVGTILAAILSLTFFVACAGVLAFSPERRQSVRRLFRRSASAVRYSRVQSNEEASLLLEPNGEFTDSDDDMLL